MKKSIISIISAVAFGASAFAGSTTVTVVPGGFTNLLTLFPGFAYVQQVSVTASTATNVSVLILDTPTNSLTYVVPAYTNYVKYATNYFTYYTNYYGATTYSYTNFALLTLTNSTPQATNNYPVRISAAALANTTVTYGSVAGLSYFFDYGIWATNTGSGNATITILYQ